MNFEMTVCSVDCNEGIRALSIAGRYSPTGSVNVLDVQLLLYI
jgi:hypothetical protein